MSAQPVEHTDFPVGHPSLHAQKNLADGVTLPGEQAMHLPIPTPAMPALLDPTLSLASIAVDDIENLRKAQENRYRSLTRSGTSENGLEWGYGLDNRDPNVAAAGALVDQIAELEKAAVKNLEKAMKRHPLGPYVEATKGLGKKQVARLLGAIGDPYWHTAEDRPRTVSELWAYCGLHTLPTRGHSAVDSHGSSAPGGVNVAAKRKKGVQANWSNDAKMRAWNIANSCLKAGGPYREVYDRRREVTAERTHAVECVRCGPSGKPAQPGSEWSKGHQLADALRIVSKEVLKDLWKQARDIHEGVAR